jgi:uncharacterized metal-binding protein
MDGEALKAAQHSATISGKPELVLVIPCSGIGKVHGLLSREAAYMVVDELAAEKAEVVCLALLVREDEETLEKVRSHPCATIDGCAKACAQKNVEIAGGNVTGSYQVTAALRRHRGAEPGDGSDLSEEGWEICRELAESVAADLSAGPALDRPSREMA